ncbi:hypothetical protein M413DRAFT_9764 [Hebeloma cylindrosporum]|uniref:Uncharacterized protein n=1 Tax=Hebeloma cylindrosporum TaxID=76867 RepID=A0A0C3CIA6_HEBCY|nr:hypothetical protein M413DRAFT_9764 [Hebeloma cylindrosporum h7]
MEPRPPPPAKAKKPKNFLTLLAWKKFEGNYDAQKADIDKFNEELVSRSAPGTLDKYHHLELNWECFMANQEPRLSSNEIWYSDVVSRNILHFLPRIVQVSVGRAAANGKIKASTLCTYLTQLCLAIYRLVTDRVSGEKVGNELLRGKLFSDLKDQVHTLILSEKLDRHEELKTYFGVEELQLIIEQALEDTKLSGRASAIQRITITVICCMTGLRPSSLGPSNKTYGAQGKYPRLFDITIFQTAPLTWRVPLNVRFFKGYLNSPVGLSRVMSFDPVTNWFNVPFDAAMWIVLYLFLRGALEGINASCRVFIVGPYSLASCKTLQDLANNKLANIPIKASMKDEPLFLALGPRGKAFAVPQRTISAKGVSDGIAASAESAGLPPGTAYNFRRDNGDTGSMGVVLGKEVAELILVHQSDGQLHHYSRNTANVDLVGARLNELPQGHAPNVIHQLERHKMTSRAVQAMRILLDPEARAEAGGSQRTVLTVADKQELVDNDPEVERLENVADDAFEAFKNCYEYTKPRGKRDDYPRNRLGAGYILKNPTTTLLVPQETADEARDALYAATEDLVKYNRSSRKSAKRTKAQTNNRKRKEQHEGTTEELDKARDELKKPSKILRGIMPMVGVEDSTADDIEADQEIHKGGFSLFFVKKKKAFQSLCNLNGKVNDIHDVLFREGSAEELVDPPAPEPLQANPVASASDMRLALMTFVLEPINAASELKEKLEVTSLLDKPTMALGPAINAAPLTTTTRNSKIVTTKRKYQLRGHAVIQHTPWRDLILKMIIVSPNQTTTFKCPVATCSFRSRKEKTVRDHCKDPDECSNAEHYQDMEMEYETIRANFRAVKVPRAVRGKKPAEETE